MQGPPCPPELAYLLGWFSELSRKRTSGMNANPITYSEMLAWASLTGRHPSPFEIDVLNQLDAIVLAKPKDLDG